MKRLSAVVAFLALALTVAVGCGGSGNTTTVIKEAPAETVERTTTVEAPAPRPENANDASSQEVESEPEPQGEPPNVVGLPLPQARRLLKEAGYRAAAKNTDTAFGIVVESNYTICTQGEPRRDLVPVLAQKYGC